MLKGVNIAFPFKDTKVSCVSTEESKTQDDTVLGKLCELGYDGYYMVSVNGFHSEVGLCPKALYKLELEKSKRNTTTGVEGPTKKKHRPNNNHNNNRNNSTRRRSRFTLNNSFIKGSLF